MYIWRFLKMGIPNTIGFNTEIVNFWVIKMGTPIWKAPHIYICIMNILCDSDIYIYTHTLHQRFEILGN